MAKVIEKVFELLFNKVTYIFVIEILLNLADRTVHGECVCVCVCTAKAARPCEVDGKTYKDGDEFKPNCSQLCTCQDGAYACASLCPQEERAPSPQHCRDAQLVAIVGQCCREWVCPHAHSIAEPDDSASAANNANTGNS